MLKFKSTEIESSGNADWAVWMMSQTDLEIDSIV